MSFLNIFKKKEVPPYIPFKCGTEFSGSYLDRIMDAAEHGITYHDISIITKGNRRKKKVVCIPTGKWWYQDIPPLKQVK